MKIGRFANQEAGTPVPLPDTRRIWNFCLLLGAIFWIIGLVFWWQGGIEETLLFHFDAQRIAYDPVVALSKWLSSNGMATITVIFVLYLLLSKVVKSLDAPLTVYLYTICSYGWSGIGGDLLKAVISRPRPAATFGSELLILSQSLTPAIPSGHATKSIALILPFILLVGHSKGLHKAIKIVIALIGIGVCFSRVVLGAHYLSDVLAGIGTALIGLPLSMLFANVILRKAKQEQLPRLSMVWGMILIFLTLVFLAL